VGAGFAGPTSEVIDQCSAATRLQIAGAIYNPSVPARFYAPGARSGQVVALPEDEAAHLTRVLRLTAGERVVVFDGRGHEFDATVERAARSEAHVAIGRARLALREARVALTLAQAVLKSDKMDDVVRDAVMMGAAAIQPVVSARSEITLAALERGRRRERWQRIAVSSAKQCGRAVVPQVLDPAPFDVVVSPGPLGAAFMFFEPAAAEDVRPLAAISGAPPEEAAVFIGPEGGWAPEEIDRGAQSAHLVTLGPRTLRADAMAVVALSALFTIWGEF
jgi:16S rRNA (uracil1498-N3)-methyltransferase